MKKYLIITLVLVFIIGLFVIASPAYADNGNGSSGNNNNIKPPGKSRVNPGAGGSHTPGIGESFTWRYLINQIYNYFGRTNHGNNMHPPGTSHRNPGQGGSRTPGIGPGSPLEYLLR